MNQEDQERTMILCKVTIDKYITTRKLLSSARSYGTWDLMGGGMISSMIKQDKLSDVSRSLDEANRNLSELLREINETDISLVPFKTNSIHKFLDIYMDNFISDAIVNYTMEGCNRDIDELIQKLDDIMLELKEKYRNEFPEEDNQFTQIEETQVICPRCNSVHLIECTRCPYCGVEYDENITPMLKLN